MVDGSARLPVDKVEPMHTDPISLSSGEHSTSQWRKFDLYLTVNYADQYDSMNQFMVHPKQLSDTVQVTFPTYDSDMPRPYTSIASNAGAFSTKSP